MSVPIAVWNQIAPKMQSKELAQMFSVKSQEKHDQLIDSWAIKAVGREPEMQMAYQLVAPLLMENVAISKWTASNPQWRQALPEVLTVAEAIRIAQADYLLSATQTKQLIEQLNKL